jgi:hypothetical protein
MTRSSAQRTTDALARHRRPNTSGRVGDPFVSGDPLLRWPFGICNTCANIVDLASGDGHDPSRHGGRNAR